MVLVEEAYLQGIPLILRLDDAIHLQLLAQLIANGPEIIPPQVVKIGVSYDLLQEILRFLRYLRSHDHPADALDLLRGITKLRQALPRHIAAQLLMIFTADHESAVMVHYSSK